MEVSDDSQAGHHNDGTKDLIGSGYLKYRYCGQRVLLTTMADYLFCRNIRHSCHEDESCPFPTDVRPTLWHRSLSKSMPPSGFPHAIHGPAGAGPAPKPRKPEKCMLDTFSSLCSSLSVFCLKHAREQRARPVSSRSRTDHLENPCHRDRSLLFAWPERLTSRKGVCLGFPFRSCWA